jgi:hypothetical protein
MAANRVIEKSKTRPEQKTDDGSDVAYLGQKANKINECWVAEIRVQIRVIIKCSFSRSISLRCYVSK